MKEIKGNFWDECEKYNALIVTTNGVLKNNGKLVMGKGIAKEFADMFPELQEILGDLLVQSGLHSRLVMLHLW